MEALSDEGFQGWVSEFVAPMTSRTHLFPANLCSIGRTIVFCYFTFGTPQTFYPKTREVQVFTNALERGFQFFYVDMAAGGTPKRQIQRVFNNNQGPGYKRQAI